MSDPRPADLTDECPVCSQAYPAPTDGAAAVTCGKCGYRNVLEVSHGDA